MIWRLLIRISWRDIGLLPKRWKTTVGRSAGEIATMTIRSPTMEATALAPADQL